MNIGFFQITKDTPFPFPSNGNAETKDYVSIMDRLEYFQVSIPFIRENISKAAEVTGAREPSLKFPFPSYGKTYLKNHPGSFEVTAPASTFPFRANGNAERKPVILPLIPLMKVLEFQFPSNGNARIKPVSIPF